MTADCVRGIGQSVGSEGSRGIVGHLLKNFDYDFVKKFNVIQLLAWRFPEFSRKLSFQDFVTKAQDGDKNVSLRHRPPLPSENTPGTHFC